MMMNKSVASKLVFFLLVCLVGSCGSRLEQGKLNNTAKTTAFTSLLGRWEGFDDKNQLVAHLTIEEYHLQIEYLEDPASVSRRGYKTSREGNQIVIRVENIKEPLTIELDEHRLRFELNDEDRRKPDVPALTMLTFRRTH